MLKIKKSNLNDGINVIIKDTDGRFAKQLRNAFFIALSIHFLLFFCFHITKIKLIFSKTSSQPTNVLAETHHLQPSTIASSESMNTVHMRIPVRPQSLPSLGFEAPNESVHESPPILSKQKEIPTPEKELIMPPLLSSRQMLPRPIALVISGDIKSKLIGTGLTEDKIALLPKNLIKRNSRVVFSVAVNGKDGTIFWYEFQEKTSLLTLDSFAESLLKEIKFLPDNSNFLAKGTVEIFFNQGDDS